MASSAVGSFARGVAETLGIVAACVAVGLVGGAALRGAGGAAYPPPAMAAQGGALWLVDGFNVLSVGLLGGRSRTSWWGRERRDELLALARGLPEAGAEVWVVFDGPAPAGVPGPGAVRAVFAPSADAWLLARLGEHPQPARVRVVTADRRLAARARRRGAQVVAPGEFLALCRQERPAARPPS